MNAEHGKERFSYNNPPHWANQAITDWQVFDDGKRISVDTLVGKANQQEELIKDLLAEIQDLKAQVKAGAAAPQLSDYLNFLNS